MTSLHKWAKTLEKQLKTIKVGQYSEKQMIDLLIDGVSFCQSICPENDFNSGELKQSITFNYDKQSRVGYIYSKLPLNRGGVQYLVYLEFGTGIYATNGKGRQGGWVYKHPKRANEYYFTEGQKPQPIMYTTSEYLKGKVPKGIKVRYIVKGSDGGIE